jgi:hypothetical protein
MTPSAIEEIVGDLGVGWLPRHRGHFDAVMAEAEEFTGHGGGAAK